MASPLLYVACLVGALGLYLVLRSGRRVMAGGGAIVGLGGLAWLFVEALSAVAAEHRPNVFFWVFAMVAIVAAARMVTHGRPVYSALYFIAVVVSSAGLFLLLGAEFMAFALIIVYAGAILITYLFVLMLAQQAPNENQPEAQAEYDAVPREPAAAVAVGFIVVALLSHMTVDGAGALIAPDRGVVLDRAAAELALMPKQLEAAVEEAAPGTAVPEDGFTVAVVDETLVATGVDGATVTLGDDAIPQNVQSVGISLVYDFPASLEVAGIILLMAMFGAVVLARRQIEIGEDETREAAGLRPFDFARDDRVDGEDGDSVEGGSPA